MLITLRTVTIWDQARGGQVALQEFERGTRGAARHPFFNSPLRHMNHIIITYTPCMPEYMNNTRGHCQISPDDFSNPTEILRKNTPHLLLRIRENDGSCFNAVLRDHNDDKKYM